MSELDPKVKAQIEAVMESADSAAIEHITQVLRDLDNPEIKFRSALWGEVAKRFRAGLHKTPPCFHLHLFEELEEALGPSLRVAPCRHFDEREQIGGHGKETYCRLGNDVDSCEDCPDYVPWKDKIGPKIDCNHCPFTCEYNTTPEDED
jgi:hypothetical protein